MNTTYDEQSALDLPKLEYFARRAKEPLDLDRPTDGNYYYYNYCITV